MFYIFDGNFKPLVTANCLASAKLFCRLYRGKDVLTIIDQEDVCYRYDEGQFVIIGE